MRIGRGAAYIQVPLSIKIPNIIKQHQAIFPSRSPNLILHLALGFWGKLNCGTTNGQLSSLLDLRLEDDLAALLPHLGHERLARQDGPCEADFDVLVGAKSGRTVRLGQMKALQFAVVNSLFVNGLASNAHEAEAVQNWGLEAAHLREGGINMERAV